VSPTAASSRKRGLGRAIPSRAAGAVLALAALLALAAPAGAQVPEALLEGCAQCHGADGNSVTPDVPSLAGQPTIFIETQLILFRERLRRSEAMAPQVKGLDDPTVIALAAHYAALPPRAAPDAGDPALLARGRDLVKAGRCGTCHLPDFAGRQQIPRLAGQREDYLAMALAAYRDETRGGADTTMIDVMRGASDGEIEVLAHFLARQ
jgi:cytochrome c553